MINTIIEAKNVDVFYADKQALFDVNLKIEEKYIQGVPRLDHPTLGVNIEGLGSVGTLREGFFANIPKMATYLYAKSQGL